MAYNDFTLAEVTDRFELNLSSLPFCQELPVAVPSELFSAIFREWFPLAQQARSEKAKSELLISPVLLEVRKLVHNSIELFSGEEFSVDREQGLNGFGSIPLFIALLENNVSRTTHQAVQRARLFLSVRILKSGMLPTTALSAK